MGGFNKSVIVPLCTKRTDLAKNINRIAKINNELLMGNLFGFNDGVIWLLMDNK